MIFVNYQKMKRKFETTVSSAMSQGLINTSVRYQYDSDGNPVIVEMNSGTQNLQSAYILRDQYNRTKRIQYYGYLNGFFDRKLEENQYNITYENLTVYEYNMRISDIVNRIIGKQGVMPIILSQDINEITDVIDSYSDDNVDMYIILKLPPELEESYPYQLLIDNAHKTNKKVAVYIDTDFTDRPQSEIIEDIKTFLDNYPMIDGFFFDNVDSSPSSYSYYQGINQTIRDFKTHFDIILNCGIVPDISFFTITDYIIVFDGEYSEFNYESIQKLSDEQKIQSVILIRNCTSKSQMREIINTISSRFIYITDSDNFEHQPTYLDSEILELINKFKRINK